MDREPVRIKGNFGKRLGDLLTTRGVSYGELASGIGVSTGLISRYVSGERTPYGETLRKIASFLETTPEYLMGEKEDTPHEKKSQTHAVLSRLISVLAEDLQQIIYQTAKIFLEASGQEEDAEDTIGGRIKSLIDERGISEDEFAEKMGTTRTLLKPYLVNTRVPGKKILGLMQQALNVDMKLITGNLTDLDFMTPIQSETEKILVKLPLKSQQVLYETALRFVRATKPDALK